MGPDRNESRSRARPWPRQRAGTVEPSPSGPPRTTKPSSTSWSMNAACSVQAGCSRRSRELSQCGPLTIVTVNIAIARKLPTGTDKARFTSVRAGTRCYPAADQAVHLGAGHDRGRQPHREPGERTGPGRQADRADRGVERVDGGRAVSRPGVLQRRHLGIRQHVGDRRGLTATPSDCAQPSRRAGGTVSADLVADRASSPRRRARTPCPSGDQHAREYA